MIHLSIITRRYVKMIVYPNAKINIGLYVTEKRTDGFHNLETIFYPLGLSDILEINRAEMGASGECFFHNTGILIDCPEDKNLVIKAYRLLCADYALPAIRIHLHKIVPFGAGLGGGSADAAFMLKALNDYFELHLPAEKLLAYAATLGSDCAFFIPNRPAFAYGKGELLEDIQLSLEDYFMVLVKPPCGVSTPEAYRGIVPRQPAFNLRDIGTLEVKKWQGIISNDFEKTVFACYPEIGQIKDDLLRMGAVYASMTGSGAAVFALFEKTVDPGDRFPGCFIWKNR